MRRMPVGGDRILIMKDKWLKLLLKKTKTMEIRGRRLKPGRYWLGCQGAIHGEALLGNPLHIPDMTTWTSLQDQH